MAPQLPPAVVEMVARRDWRMHHYIWHQVRNEWLFYPPATQQALKAKGWEPPRPAQRPGADGNPQVELGNGSGEDFLYMHRQMINRINAKLAEVGQPDYPFVRGWRAVPRPGDAEEPVPPAWDTGNPEFNAFLVRVKSDAEFAARFEPWERAYTDPARLAEWSLGELGARIEFTIHNMMHMRWSADPGEIRPDVDPTTPEAIDPRWDNPAYDWLGDTYSSHVNAIFWKLHGWVDDRIEDWKRARGMAGDISWQGKWLGHMPHEHVAPVALAALLGDEPVAPAFAAEMAEVVAIIARSGRFFHFYDEVLIDDPVAPERVGLAKGEEAAASAYAFQR